MATAKEAIKGTAEFANDFMPVFREAAASTEREKSRLFEELAVIQEQKQLLEDKVVGIQKAIGELEANVLVGLKIAAREAGVKLDVTIDRKGGNGEQPRRRMTKSRLAGIAEKLMGAIPLKKNGFLPMETILKRANLDTAECKTAMQKLKRDGKIKSNGKRGPASGWQRA